MARGLPLYEDTNFLPEQEAAAYIAILEEEKRKDGGSARVRGNGPKSEARGDDQGEEASRGSGDESATAASQLVADADEQSIVAMIGTIRSFPPAH